MLYSIEALWLALTVEVRVEVIFIDPILYCFSTAMVVDTNRFRFCTDMCLPTKDGITANITTSLAFITLTLSGNLKVFRDKLIRVGQQISTSTTLLTNPYLANVSFE